MDLPPPCSSGEITGTGESKLRTILVVRPRDPVIESYQARWTTAAEHTPLGLTVSRAGFHRPAFSYRHECMTWDIVSSAPPDAATLLAVLPDRADVIEAVRLGHLCAGGLRKKAPGGYKRTLLLKADPRQFGSIESALADMPRFITGIWRVSRVVASCGETAWTHCFEQEVEDITVFLDDYMNHPHH